VEKKIKKNGVMAAGWGGQYGVFCEVDRKKSGFFLKIVQCRRWPGRTNLQEMVVFFKNIIKMACFRKNIVTVKTFSYLAGKSSKDV